MGNSSLAARLFEKYTMTYQGEFEGYVARGGEFGLRHPPGSARMSAAQSADEQSIYGFSSTSLAAQSAATPYTYSAPSLQLNLSSASKPLRVLHVGPCFARGGAEISLIDLAKSLNPTRVRIVKCLATQAHLIDPTVVAQMPAPVEAGSTQAVRQAADQFDILLYWGIALDKWLGGWRPKLAVYLAHGESRWSRELLVGSARTVDHTVAVSQRVAERVCGGFPATVILNGIDAARLAASRARSEVRTSLGIRPDDFVLGFVGRLSPEKRPELLIEAVAQLPQNFRALFVGQGPLQASLLERANARIPGRYALVSAIDHLGDYYQAMDAFGLLSAHEGFALVLLEALMSGLPVISTEVGVAPELIEDRVNGLLIPGEPAALAAAARRLHANPQWARGIAEQGRAFAIEHGHATRMARQYEDLLERLWQEKRAG